MARTKTRAALGAVLPILLVLPSLLLLFSSAAAPVGAFSGAGAGQSGNPYIITTAAQLQEMKNDLTKYYALGNNIDASDTINWNGGAGFEQIGYDWQHKFMGSFDGRGYKIYNLYINRLGTNDVGLFGTVGSGGVVKNVGMENVNVSGLDGVGGLVGYMYYGGTVSGSYSTGSVHGLTYVGGLVGLIESGGVVSNSYSTCSVSGGSKVGGLVGYMDYGTLTNSYSVGSVDGSSEVGGLVGSRWYGTVSASFWDTQTSWQLSSAGGTGKTTSQMKTQATFTSAGWDFATVWDICSVINTEYPFLRSFFPSLYYIVTTPVSPLGAGTVSGGGSYRVGVPVTLTATPSSGYQFSGWVGYVGDSTNPLTFTMPSQNVYVTANYIIVYTLSISISPLGGGLVTPISGTYTAGTTVSLTAVPSPSYTFVGWGGDASGTSPTTTVTMDTNKSITATFAQVLTYTVTTSVSPMGGGSVSGAGLYPAGQLVTLTATPTLDYIFTSWGGYLSGSENTKTFTMPADNISVTATFSPATYTLTVSVSPQGAGTVFKNPNKAYYASGDLVVLTANAASGHIFNSWGDYLSGSTNPITFTMPAQNMCVTANFLGENFKPTYNLGEPINIQAGGTVEVVTGQQMVPSILITSPVELVGVQLSVLEVASPSAPAPTGKLVFAYIDISASASVGGIVPFRVERSWVVSNSISQVCLMHYKDNGWHSLTTNFVENDGDYSYYFASTDSFSLFAIAGTVGAAPEQPPEEPPAGIGVPVLIASLIVGIIAVALATKFATPLLTKMRKPRKMRGGGILPPRGQPREEKPRPKRKEHAASAARKRNPTPTSARGAAGGWSGATNTPKKPNNCLC